MSNTIRLASPALGLALTALLGLASNPTLAHENDHDRGRSDDRPRACTKVTAAGTYGYRMNGVIVGLGPFLANGIFTHKPDGTMSADVQLVVGEATFPLSGTDGTFKTNRDCTGEGRFKTPLPQLSEVTYNFIATDGGDQIDLLNTNEGVVLQGVGRRISKAGRAPQCEIAHILGSYGYRLEGSLPGVPNAAAAGIATHTIGRPRARTGAITGEDTLNLMGTYQPRTFSGTFTLGRNCRGTGTYHDSLGQTVKVVFTAVNDGDTLFLMGADDGTAIQGVAQRVR